MEKVVVNGAIYDYLRTLIILKSIYNSNGNEKYLTIGNFNRNIKYNFNGNVKNKKEVDSKYTYYFIDDVSLLEIKDSSECICNTIKTIKKDSVKIDKVKNISQYDEAINKSITLNNIVFETDKSDLLQSSCKELDKLVKYLMQNPSFKIEITGYTDNTGKEGDNIKLSEQRAKAVAGHLIKEGIDTKRITYKGYGSKKPLLPNDTEEHKRVNRRVEFKLIAN